MTAEIFPKHPSADAYYIDGSYTPYAIVGVDKRFTGAELSAEVWHSIVRFHGQNAGPEASEEARRNMILERAANLPHYDEADA